MHYIRSYQFFVMNNPTEFKGTKVEMMIESFALTAKCNRESSRGIHEYRWWVLQGFGTVSSAASAHRIFAIAPGVFIQTMKEVQWGKLFNVFPSCSIYLFFYVAFQMQ